MKSVLKFVIILFLSFSGNAQIGGEDEVYLNGDRIEAKFNGGGLDKFSEFINKEFDYSKVTKAGKMVGSFTIDVDGNVKNIKITEFFDIESATEFIRVLRKCPKWEPAKRGGKPISIEIKYPMVFTEKSKPKQETIKSDEGITTSTTNENNAIYNLVGIEVKPEYPGGMEAFYKHISNNYRAPSDKAFKGAKVFVTFIIEKDGSMTDMKVIRDRGFGTGEEAIRVLKLCEKWTPAEQNGKKVRVLYSLPIALSSN